MFREAVRKWLAQLHREGIYGTITSTKRTHNEQQRLYQKFLQALRSNIATLPVARPGLSKHEQGLAIDIVFAPRDLPRAVELAEQYGMVWGGPRDPVHFEAGFILEQLAGARLAPIVPSAIISAIAGARRVAGFKTSMEARRATQRCTC